MKDSRPRVHEIKCHSEWYSELRFGRKRFEVRYNDRDYHEGDVLLVHEFYKCTDCLGQKLQPIDQADRPNEICRTCEGKGGDYPGVAHREVIARVWKNLPGLQPGYVILTLL